MDIEALVEKTAKRIEKDLAYRAPEDFEGRGIKMRDYIRAGFRDFAETLSIVSPTEPEVPWSGRRPDARDILAAIAFVLNQSGAVIEIDTAKMKGAAYHLNARFVQRGGGRVGLIVVANEKTDPSHEQIPYPIPHDS